VSGSPGNSSATSVGSGKVTGSQQTSTSAGGGASGQGPGHQPVEFNHAINYVNKIKVGV